MSNFLTSAGVGSIGLDHLREIRKQTQAKWESIGFLSGLDGIVKENMASLFENQAGSILTEETSATSSGSFETVVFPIVRRVFSKLLANDIVSVQAMNMPIGKLFYFVPKTSQRESNGSHPNMATKGLPSCVVGVGCEVTEFQCKNLYDLYYNDGLFDNSKGEITINVISGSPVAFSAGTCNLVANANPVVATDGTIRNVMLAMTGFDATNKGRLTGPDGNEMDTESFLASMKIINNTGNSIVDPDGRVLYADGDEIPFRLVTQKYGKGIVEYSNICDTSGTLYVELDLTLPVTPNGTQTYDGYIGSVVSGVTSLSAVTVGDFIASYASYGTLEFETEIGEVSFDLDSVVVSAEERRLRAVWSSRLAADVNAFHNIDAEAELTAMLSEQIASEIDREILRDLRKGAAWTLRWDYNGWRKASSASSPYTQKDWNQELVTKVNQISAQIHKSTLRGGANFVVVSSEVGAVLDNLEYFHASNAAPEQDTYNMGIEKVGTLQGRYKVYRDPYAPAYSVLVGHKGTSMLDSGYIYAPYIPLQLTPTMYNPFNSEPVKYIKTVYAKKFINNRFYGHVRVDGVPQFNINELR
jgi:hypothetical protein